MTCNAPYPGVMPKPSDETINAQWRWLRFLYHSAKSYNGGEARQRIALALAHQMEVEGVTEADLARLNLI